MGTHKTWLEIRTNKKYNWCRNPLAINQVASAANHSLSGEGTRKWETFGCSNTWPDDRPEQSNDIFMAHTWLISNTNRTLLLYHNSLLITELRMNRAEKTVLQILTKDPTPSCHNRVFLDGTAHSNWLIVCQKPTVHEIRFEQNVLSSYTVWT